MEYKLSMSYDNESPEPDDDLYDTESLNPYICNPVSIYIVLVELIFPGGLENFHSTTRRKKLDVVKKIGSMK